MKRARPLKPGQVWVSHAKGTRTHVRRIVAVADKRICYSTGSDGTRWCQVRAFRLWMNTYKAAKAMPGRGRTLPGMAGYRGGPASSPEATYIIGDDL